MAKSSGLGAGLIVDQYNLSNDVGAVDTIRGGPALLDITGLDKSAYERLGGRYDGGIDFTSYFNPSTGKQHDALSGLSSSDRIMSFFVGSTLGNPIYWITAKQINYDPKRAADGGLTESVQGQVSAGSKAYWGSQLLAGAATHSAAGNGTSIDRQTYDGLSGASSVFGASAVLHIISVASGTPTVAIHDSADNSSFTVVTGLTFSISAAGKEALQTATGATIRRYVRIVTTGTFTDLVFVVGFRGHITSTI